MKNYCRTVRIPSALWSCISQADLVIRRAPNKHQRVPFLGVPFLAWSCRTTVTTWCQLNNYSHMSVLRRIDNPMHRATPNILCPMNYPFDNESTKPCPPVNWNKQFCIARQCFVLFCSFTPSRSQPKGTPGFALGGEESRDPCAG